MRGVIAFYGNGGPANEGCSTGCFDAGALLITANSAASSCAIPNSVFNLLSGGNYAVLGKTNANMEFGSSGTLITGDVGVGAGATGTLEKAMINGNLFLDKLVSPTLSIHPDLIVTGSTFHVSLGGAVTDADNANGSNAVKVATQSAVTVPDGVNTTIVLAKPNGDNVVPVTLVNTHNVITIVGNSTATVVFNVTGGFTCNGCSIVLNAATVGFNPIPPQNVLWNFIGSGGDVSITKPVGSAAGIFLAPDRNLLLDKASLTGALIGAENGLELLVHSGAQLTCPK